MKRLVGLVVAITVFLVTPVVPVRAVTTNTPASGPVSNTPADLTSRVEARRSALATKLTPAENTKVKNNCVAAQAKVDAITTKVNNSSQPFLTRYDTYNQRLNSLLQKRTTAGKNTSELNAQVAVLTQKYQVYKAAAGQLTADLTDLKALDCQSNPAGFVATLQDARTQLQTIQSSRKDIAAYAKDTILKTLEKIKQES